MPLVPSSLLLLRFSSFFYHVNLIDDIINFDHFKKFRQGTAKIITNGEYKSAQHRAVTNAGRSRLSVATFHDPSKTRQISPAFHPPRYRPVIYGDYVSSWYTKGPEGKRNLDALLL